ETRNVGRLKTTARISRAISRARRKRSWPNCSSWEGTLPGTATSRRSTTTSSAATSRAPAAAARNTKSAMARPLSMGKPLKLLPLLLLGSAAWAGIWPEQFGPAKRVPVMPVTAARQKLWAAYGLRESEQAEYDRRSDERL